MRALVTGATGFTGSAVCRRLVHEGADVTAFVRSVERAEPLRKLGVDCRKVDITDPDDVERSFGTFDVVFHIAALYRTEKTDRSEFTRVNVDATRNLLNSAKRNGAGRFIHCSTVGVHGRIDDPPAAEDYRFRPEDHYQGSKLAGELLARSYFATGLPGAVVRPAGIYGPGDLRFLKLFKGVQSRWFPMIGSGQTLYHFTYIDDLVEGFMLAGTHPRALGEVITIGGSEHTTVGQFVNEIAAALGCPPPRFRIPAWPVQAAAVLCETVCRPLGIEPPLYQRRLEFFTLDRAFTIAKARTLLGYDPKVGMSEGIARTAAWYREQRLL
jgi:nucleoside-diphosphate-sugar epimerase